MKTLGKIFLCAVILFIGAYWAATNPTTARSVKNDADNAVSFCTWRNCSSRIEITD